MATNEPRGRAPRFLGNQNGAEVVDVSQRRPGYNGVAERFEEAMAVVIVEAVLGFDTLGPGAGQAVGREVCTGDVLHTVDAVCIPRDRMNARAAVQRDAERKQELHIAPAAAVAAHGYCGFATGKQNARGLERLAASRN